jgi:hypothetical protein
MEYKITRHHIEAPPSQSHEDLRRVFESAVCELYQGDRSLSQRMLYRSPIVPRRKILGISKDGAEKRALSDAARALAQLWKV